MILHPCLQDGVETSWKLVLLIQKERKALD